MKKCIAIFASGSGSNAENIIRYFEKSDFVEVALVLSNKKDAFVLERARRFNIPYYIFSKEEWERGDHILQVLAQYHIHLIVLAGFLLKISTPFLQVYPNRIINIHPALLPKYGGKGMYGDKVHQAVLDSREKETGITIHYINEYYDEGGVIFQATCPVSVNDTVAEVARKVHALEYLHYPSIIEQAVRSLDD